MRLYLSPDASHLQEILPVDSVNESGKPVVFDVNASDKSTLPNHPFLLVDDSLPSLPDTCGILSVSGRLRLDFAYPTFFVGTRNMTLQEKAMLAAKKINTYSMKEITVNGLRETCDAAMANALRFPQLFVNVNLDVLDPVFIGQSAHDPQGNLNQMTLPGGMTTRDLIYFLQRIRLLRNFYGAGISIPTNPQQEQIALKLLLELA